EPPSRRGTHHDWLQHSLHIDRSSQFLKRFLIELPPRLVRILIDPIDLQKKHRLPLRSVPRSRSLQFIHTPRNRLRSDGRPREPALSGVEGSTREFSRGGRKRRRRRSSRFLRTENWELRTRSIGCPILPRTLRKGGRCHHTPRPRQQGLQSAPQSPPFLRQLLVSLISLISLLRSPIDRRIGCSHQVFPFSQSQKIVILSAATSSAKRMARRSRRACPELAEGTPTPSAAASSRDNPTYIDIHKYLRPSIYAASPGPLKARACRSRISFASRM